MKTKKILVLLLALAFVSLTSSVYAQHWYINASWGNNWGLAKNLLSYETQTNQSPSGNSYDYKIVKGSGSYGKGLQMGATLGYKLGDHIGAELGLSYLLGHKFSGTHSSTTLSGIIQSYSEKTSVRIFRLTPSVCINTGEKSFRAYTALGLMLAIFPKLKDEYDEKNSAPGVKDMTTHKESYYSGGLPLGFSGKLGAEYLAGSRISFFLEFQAIAQSWAPKKREITTYEINGTDKLSTLSISEKETEFVDSYTSQTPANSTTNSSPSKHLKFYIPLSSAGLNFGIKIILGKVAPAKTDK